MRGEFGLLVDDNIGGGGLDTLLVILRMVHKYQVTFFYLMDLVDTGGGAIGFAGTALGMAPLHPQALSSGPGAYTYFGLALLAGLAGGLLCATMLFRLSRAKN